MSKIQHNNTVILSINLPFRYVAYIIRMRIFFEILKTPSATEVAVVDQSVVRSSASAKGLPSGQF
jgi:hypothetical protein